jgi:hypothetical protein
MTAIGIALLVAGIACWGLSIILLALRVRALNVVLNRQAERIAQLELDVQAALVLARKRLVPGRSGR